MYLFLWFGKRYVLRGGCFKDKVINGFSSKRKVGVYFSCVKKLESIVLKEGGVVIIMGRLWGNFCRKIVEEYRLWI